MHNALNSKTPRCNDDTNSQTQSSLQLLLFQKCLPRHERHGNDISLFLPRDRLAADWTRAFAFITFLSNQQ